MRGDETSASMVIVEAGALWPRFAQQLQRHATHAVVESQPVTESPTDFVGRVERRLAKLAQSSVELAYAVIATNERIDVSARDARERLARTIVGAMIESGGGELILSAGEHVADPVRHHLFELAGTLVDELAGSTVGVNVRFVSTSQSAVRVVRPSDPDLVVAADAG